MNSKKRGGYTGGGGTSSQTKRRRQDEDDDAPGTFEQYLANMEDDDMDYEDGPAGLEGQGPEQESTYDRSFKDHNLSEDFYTFILQIFNYGGINFALNLFIDPVEFIFLLKLIHL